MRFDLPVRAVLASREVTGAHRGSIIRIKATELSPDGWLRSLMGDHFPASQHTQTGSGSMREADWSQVRVLHLLLLVLF